MRSRIAIALAAGLAAAFHVPASAPAQAYPTRSIEIVVPFVAGGGTDLVARLVADHLSKKWGQPMLVVNKPGGGGVPGTRAALKEGRPDGYTVLMDIHTTSSMMIGAWKTPPLTLADRKYAGRMLELMYKHEGLGLAAPQLGTDAESLPLGGLGVHLMRQVTDLQSYRHDVTNGNQLTLVKFLAPPQGADT